MYHSKQGLEPIELGHLWIISFWPLNNIVSMMQDFYIIFGKYQSNRRCSDYVRSSGGFKNRRKTGGIIKGKIELLLEMDFSVAEIAEHRNISEDKVENIVAERLFDFTEEI